MKSDKAASILKDAGWENLDSYSLKATSTVLNFRKELLEPIQPLAKNYEDVLFEKLWPQVSESPKQPVVGKARYFEWITFALRQVTPLSASLTLFVFVSVGVLYWATEVKKHSLDFLALSAMIKDFKEDGATEDELDAWLASVSDADTRNLIMAQDISAITRGFEGIEDIESENRVLREVQTSLGFVPKKGI
jgi:hypothetical protein